MNKINGKKTTILNKILSFFMAFAISVLYLCSTIGSAETVYAASYVAYIGTRGYESLSSAISAATSGSTITLSTDIRNSSIVSISKTVTINGNGHKVLGYGFAQTSGTLTLKNITFDGEGTSSSNYMFTNSSGATLNLQNGTVIKNYKGTGFASMNIRGILNMYDGATISGLTGLYGDLRLDASGATFNMYGGTISNNSSANTSSSSYHEGVIMYLSNGASMNMSGGQIINNTYGSFAVPGTIFLHASGTNRFTMTGGIISDNAASYGGAVYNNGTSNVITISGTAQIYNNKGASMSAGISNIYLKSDQLITIGTNHMAEASSVGVYTETTVSKSRDVKFATNAKLSDALHFTSDYSANAGIIFCDGTNDYAANGSRVLSHHTSHAAGTLWLSTAAAHVHKWQYEASGNELDAYCVGTTNPEVCVHSGIEKAAKLLIEADDWIYGNGVYDGAQIINELTAAVSMNVSEVSYYSTTEEGVTTGGELVNAPSEVGYYYAKITVDKYTLVDAFKIEREKLTYHTEALNNKADDAGQLIKKVSGDSATTDLKVVLKDKEDSIKMYKLADSNWNPIAEEYQTPQWNETVARWIQGTVYDTPVYSSVEALGAASSSLWAGFFNDMLVNEGNISAELGEVDLTNYSYDKHEATDETDQSYISLTSLEFGTYAILANNGGDKYNPLIVNIYPKMEGPAYYSYVESLITVYIKDAAVAIDKTINDMKMDTVEIGQTVDFAVEFSMPKMYNDRVTLSSNSDPSVNDYTLEFEDRMSDAFKLNSESIAIEYKANASDTEWAELENPEVTYFAFVSESYTGTKTKVTAENGPTISTDEIYNTELTGKYYTSKSAKLYALSSEPGVSDTGIKETVTRLKFNVSALKTWLKKDSTPNSIAYVRITYKADVTKNAQVGNENNYNTAYIHYESNNSGTSINTEESTVNAYTYAVRVLKIDGDTAEEATPTYISGAVFNLYKEVDTFIDEEWLVGTEENATNPGFLSDYKKAHSNYYYYEEETTDVDSEGNNSGDDNGEDDGQTHVITRAFKPFRMNFTSVATAEGYVVSGLKEGNYVLSEETAPSGYKRLAEDMLFTINRLSDDEAVISNKGSLSAFVDSEGQLNTSGIYTIKVLNFKGLTLPSTGGVGTMIFTIIGMFVMLVATIFLILKKNLQKDIELFL